MTAKLSESLDPFVHKRVVVLHPETQLHEAARAMCENQIGCIVVADHQGHIVGIATDRDLVCGGIAISVSPEARLGDVMTSQPVTIEETAGLEAAVSQMEQFGIRRVPVIRKMANQRQRCVGIVTLDDLIASRTLDSDRLSRIVQQQIIRRHRRQIKIGTEETLERSFARSEQTLNRFYKTIRKCTLLDEPVVSEVTRILLGSLIQRLHFTGASHLIAQLPSELQEDLLDLPAGPARHITLQFMKNELMKKFGFNEPTAERTMNGFFRGLKELIVPGTIEHVKAQLPIEFREVFEKAEETPEKKEVA